MSLLEWRTLCYPGFAINDAKVACHQLGFTIAVGFWHYGQGSDSLAERHGM